MWGDTLHRGCLRQCVWVAPRHMAPRRRSFPLTDPEGHHLGCGGGCVCLTDPHRPAGCPWGTRVLGAPCTTQGRGQEEAGTPKGRSHQPGIAAGNKGFGGSSVEFPQGFFPGCLSSNPSRRRTAG